MTRLAYYMIVGERGVAAPYALLDHSFRDIHYESLFASRHACTNDGEQQCRCTFSSAVKERAHEGTRDFYDV